ncbi:glutamyl-tRNA amidotransferase [Mycoplasma struthionis]|uniref:Glutamyl-tRNA amidotransferase n=1 Tax=Mycoplasma struthionis TaxID=538220 RepID=A0A3G8LH58_9MOLU|nr:glutamyl-tRNA amidotransferase [Mycoplasma struthionis]AZG68674.1 glutamyl-tRNA amidotransferase [Mycoplasma struthionis]TPI01925.1 glutamyl-tRNA amidotransferase [Mycoplasma struthionis]
MNDEYLKNLAKNLLFEPNEEVIALAKKLLKSIEIGLDELHEFNLDDIKPLARINEKALSFDELREDEIDKSFYLSKETILKNAANNNEDFVIMKRVVNEK